MYLVNTWQLAFKRPDSDAVIRKNCPHLSGCKGEKDRVRKDDRDPGVKGKVEKRWVYFAKPASRGFTLP